MGFAHLVLWVLLVSIPCKGAWLLICGTSEVSLLPVWFGLVLQQETDLLEKGFPNPNSEQSCEHNTRCCCHLLASFTWFLADKAWFLAPSRTLGLHLCEGACAALRGALLQPEPVLLSCKGLGTGLGTCCWLQRCAAVLRGAKPPRCQRCAATGKGCPSSEQL